MNILPPSLVQEYAEQTNKGLKIPENSIVMAIVDPSTKKAVHREIILNKGFGEDLTDYIGKAVKNNDIYEQKIKFE